MKTCLICGETAQDNCAMCSKCGEASWTPRSDGSPAQERARIAAFDANEDGPRGPFGAQDAAPVEIVIAQAEREPTDEELELLTKPEPPVARKGKR